MVVLLLIGQVMESTSSYWIMTNSCEAVLCIANVYFIHHVEQHHIDVSKIIFSFRLVFIGFIILIGVGYLINNATYWAVIDVFRFVGYPWFGILLFRNRKK